MSSIVTTLVLLASVFTSLTTATTIPLLENLRTRQSTNFKPGAWLMTYTPTGSSQTYKGPLRITSNSTDLRISGDLYNGTISPDPSKGTPKLPRSNYWAFLNFNKLSAADSATYALDVNFYLYAGRQQTNQTVWKPESPITGDPIPLDGGYVAEIKAKTAPSGYPDPTAYFDGEIKSKTNGTTLGKFTMGWVDNYLRRYTVEIAAEQGLERPLSDTSGTRTWEKVFAEAHVKMDVVLGKGDIPGPGGDGRWTGTQAHDAMMKYRNDGKPIDLDQDWRIFLLVTRRLHDVARGVMIDGDSKEWNYIPREICAIAYDWPIGTRADGSRDDPRRKWPEELIGKPFYNTTKESAIRTAFHEVGHFMNLPHPFAFQAGLMDDTDSYVDAIHNDPPESDKPWPENVNVKSYNFNDDDKLQMAHRPDTHVRPGWQDFGGATDANKPDRVPNLLAVP